MESTMSLSPVDPVRYLNWTKVTSLASWNSKALDSRSVVEISDPSTSQLKIPLLTSGLQSTTPDQVTL